MPKIVNVDLTPEQQAVLTMLTTQNCANIINLAQMVGDMSSDASTFLRNLGEPEFAHCVKFLINAKPETFKFLQEARPEEIAYLQYGTRIVSALILVGSAIKLSVIGFAAFFAGAVLFSERVQSWFKFKVGN